MWLYGAEDRLALARFSQSIETGGMAGCSISSGAARAERPQQTVAAGAALGSFRGYDGHLILAKIRTIDVGYG
jgi:hypothetical protein